MTITANQVETLTAEITFLCEKIYAEIEQRHTTDEALMALPLTNILLNDDKTMFDEEVGFMRGNTDGITQDECVQITAKALRGADSTLQDLGLACELSLNDFPIKLDKSPINPAKLGRWMTMQSVQQQGLFAIRNLLEEAISLQPDGFIVIFLRGEQFIMKGDEQGWKQAVGNERQPVSAESILERVTAALAVNREMKQKLEYLYTAPLSFS